MCCALYAGGQHGAYGAMQGILDQHHGWLEGKQSDNDYPNSNGDVGTDLNSEFLQWMPRLALNHVTEAQVTPTPDRHNITSDYCMPLRLVLFMRSRPNRCVNRISHRHRSKRSRRRCHRAL